MYNIIQLNDKDLSELQIIAKELGIKKTDSYKKEDLVYKILDEQAIVGATKKVAADKLKEERKEEKKKRSRVTPAKKEDKVVSATKTGEVTKVEADPEDGMFGLFGFIGTVPNTKIFEGIIDMDERGYIKTDADMHTNIPGVYAAGDVRVKSLRQVVTAAADGAIAAVQVERSMSDYF